MAEAPHLLVDHEAQLVRDVALERRRRSVKETAKANLAPVKESAQLRDKLGVRERDLEERREVIALIAPERPFELNLGVEDRATVRRTDGALIETEPHKVSFWPRRRRQRLAATHIERV